jgi:acetolactate decarboxylase
MHKAVHEGDTAGKVALPLLLAEPHLFAIGPVADLRGEITVIDGVPFIGVVGDAGPFAEKRANVQAAFLVWAHEPRWVRVAIPDTVRSEDEVEAFVPQAARDAGLAPDKPVAFRIEGRAERMDLHVIWQAPGTPPGKDAHDKAKVTTAMTEASVAIVGFWSAAHRGVFTPGFSDIHMHVVSGDGKTTGHVDSVRLLPGAVLLLPDRRGESKDAP